MGDPCSDDHCVTCSDEGVPMRIVSVETEGLAVCADGTEVMTDLVGDVGPGDTVLVHAGVALVRVPDA